MSINASTGALYGAPTAAGTFNLTVTVRDSSSPQLTTSKVLSFAVVGAITAISITTSSFNPPTATVGTAYGAQQAVVATGGTTPYTWSVSGQPSGMSMNATTGALYGAPTASGTFNLTVTAKDSSSPQLTASKVVTLTVSPATQTLSITSTGFSPTTGTVGVGYSAQQAMMATGGTTPYTWSVSGQPSGMLINASSGALYGAPTASGTFNITVTVTDSSSPAADDIVGAVVHCAPRDLAAFDHEHWIQPNNGNGRNRVFGAAGHDGHGWHHPIHMVCLRPAERDVNQPFVGRALRHTRGSGHV